jgi:hypothetical protein
MSLQTESKERSSKKGFRPCLSYSDIGKYCVVYRDEDSLVKGTRLYEKRSEAEYWVKLIGDPNIVVKQVSCPRRVQPSKQKAKQ